MNEQTELRSRARIAKACARLGWGCEVSGRFSSFYIVESPFFQLQVYETIREWLLFGAGVFEGLQIDSEDDDVDPAVCRRIERFIYVQRVDTTSTKE